MLDSECVPEPILAVTGALVFAFVFGIATRKDTKLVSLMLIVNAILCHTTGRSPYVSLDVGCNVAMIIVVLSTTKWKHSRLVAGIAALSWMLNHSLIQSAAVHTTCVQILGALCLYMW